MTYLLRRSDLSRDLVRLARLVLKDRLQGLETIEWALKLGIDHREERAAIQDVILEVGLASLSEPWRTSWELVLEYWAHPPLPPQGDIGVYEVQKRLASGEKSTSLIKDIVGLVEPNLEVKAHDLRWRIEERPRRLKSFSDVIDVSFTSGRLLDLDAFKLHEIDDAYFLQSLALALENRVAHALSIARRMRWNGQERLWLFGRLNRAYYAGSVKSQGEEQDPDRYHQGIAPAVKLLAATVERLSVVDRSIAQLIILRWQLHNNSIYLRIWFGWARNKSLVESHRVASVLLAMEERPFWHYYDFPEVAETRAIRFDSLDAQDQSAVLARLRRGPSAKYWRKQVPGEKRREEKTQRAVMELQRIKSVAKSFPKKALPWIDRAIKKYPLLSDVTLETGFPESAKAGWVLPNPDRRYDELNGLSRLETLEAVLSQERTSFTDDPRESARDWLREGLNASAILQDLSSLDDYSRSRFPLLWQQILRAHTPDHEGNDYVLMLDLLMRLPDALLAQDVFPIADWFDRWHQRMVSNLQAFDLWHRIWPMAVADTNQQSEEYSEDEIEPRLSFVEAKPQSAEHRRLERIERDILNSAAGRLLQFPIVTLFNGKSRDEDAEGKTRAWALVNQSMDADGYCRIIVRARYVLYLNYFLHLDLEWTQRELIVPLRNVADEDYRALWQELARMTRFQDVLKFLGNYLPDRILDEGLEEDSRKSLLFSALVEILHAFDKERASHVDHVRLQQALRLVPDALRSFAAQHVTRFVSEIRHIDKATSPEARGEDLFRRAVIPFLKHVWPQEVFLVTPGVSDGFAGLPAECGEAFAEAVTAIEPYLVPFDCWSLADYGLYGKDQDDLKIKIINSKAKAAALLVLLDLTIGKDEGAVVPHDLSSALQQIGQIDPSLDRSPAYQRLLMLARR